MAAIKCSDRAASISIYALISRCW